MATMQRFIDKVLEDHPSYRGMLGIDPEDPMPSPPEVQIPSWCHCNRCRPMPTPEEQLCCRRRDGTCITISAGQELNEVVLNERVLVVAIHNANDLFAFNHQTSNDTLRNAAYRQYVLWKFGRLGAGNRVVIPSCVVWKIRTNFPSADGVYVGFIPRRVP